MSEEEMIRGCLRNERLAQRAFYDIYSAKMMHLCIRYSKNNQDARNALLEGFKNIFSKFRDFPKENAKLKKERKHISLEEWVKKEFICAIIRYMHANKKEYFVSSTVSIRDAEMPLSAEISDEQIIQSVGMQEIIKALQRISPSYRAVYNLHEIDGYSHREISKLLDISEYSSKDMLTKAKFNIRKNLLQIITQEQK